MAQFDILLDENEEFVDVNGDFRTGDASNKLMKYIIDSHQGSWKEFPLLGVGIRSFLNASTTRPKIEKEIKAGLKNDVFTNPLVDASGFPGEIIVDKMVIRSV